MHEFEWRRQYLARSRAYLAAILKVRAQ